MFKSRKKKEEIKSSSSHIESPQSFNNKISQKKSLKSNKLYGTPTIFEQTFGDAISKRTELFNHHTRSLGPPDLVHLSDHHGSKDYGQFHYVTGLDLSSIAGPVAYLTKRVYDNSGNSSSGGSINSIGTYCSWNSFSKCDLRIRTEFPGQKSTVQLIGMNGKPSAVKKLNASSIPSNNNSANRIYKSTNSSDMYESSLCFKTVNSSQNIIEGIPEEIWLQTYVSCIIRNVLFSDSLEYSRPALVQQNLISTKSSAKKIIDLIIKMLPKGFLTGASELYQGADFIHNYLVDTLMKILKISELYDYTIDLIEPLIATNFNYHLILVQILVEARSNEVRLIKELSIGLNHFLNFKAIKGKNYADFYLLAQSKIMSEKDLIDSALYLAIRAIEKNPTEFLNWTNLLETYIIKKDVHNALLTLNSCPVYSLPSAKAVLRIKEENSLIDYNNPNFKFPEPSQEGYLAQVWGQANRGGPVYLKDKDTILSEDFASSSEMATVDPILLRLSGPKLKGTFKVAYNYLSGLAVLVGWDNLLKIRTEVFVMEGEFKNTNNAKATDAKDEPIKSRSKRLCERWLDSLFFMLYDDLKVVSIWETKAKKSGNTLTHSTLEWELIGITAFRAKHYDLAISALRTSLKAKFSIISAKQLLEIFKEFFLNYHLFKRINRENMFCKDLFFIGSNNLLYPSKKEFIIDKFQIEELSATEQLNLINEQSLENNLYLDLILEVLIRTFSWNYRWYEDFSIDCLIFLKQILKVNERDLIINKLRAEFESEGKAVKLFERYVSWIEMFEES